MAILEWIRLNIGSVVHSVPMTWPMYETVHFFGLCLLLGALIIIDLRLLGFNRGVSMLSVHDLLPWVFIGFGMNLVSGIAFFVSDPYRYAVNIGFLIKMGLLILAGLNALYYQRKLAPLVDNWTETTEVPTNAKVVGGLSLLLWFGVLVYGRLIPFVGSG
jgi:hypothetical protein